MNLIDQLRGLINKFLEKFISGESLRGLVVVVIMIIFWILLGLLVTILANLIVGRTKKFEDKHSRQSKTMSKLINNLIKALFIFWIILKVLKEIGFDVVPVLAGAGVLAFAVGFGAQELIKDMISGFFLILEKTFSIDDYVEIGSNKGTVLEIGLRRTKIKNWKGEIITINNGDIKTVKNYSLSPSVAAIEFNTDFRQDLNVFETKEFKTFIKTFANNHEEVIDEGSSIIVTDLLGGVVTLRIAFKTNIRKAVGVERDFRKALLKYAKENNIDLEVPVVVEHDNLHK